LMVAVVAEEEDFESGLWGWGGIVGGAGGDGDESDRDEQQKETRVEGSIGLIEYRLSTKTRRH